MEITEIRVKPVEARNENFMGWASVTFDDVFVVHNIRIIRGRKGVFVAMPNRRVKNGEFRDIAHPLTNEFRKELEEKILAKYEEESGEKLDRTAGVDPEEPSIL